MTCSFVVCKDPGRSRNCPTPNKATALLCLEGAEGGVALSCQPVGRGRACHCGLCRAWHGEESRGDRTPQGQALRVAATLEEAGQAGHGHFGMSRQDLPDSWLLSTQSGVMMTLQGSHTSPGCFPCLALPRETETLPNMLLSEGFHHHSQTSC